MFAGVLAAPLFNGSVQESDDLKNFINDCYNSFRKRAQYERNILTVYRKTIVFSLLTFDDYHYKLKSNSQRYS